MREAVAARRAASRVPMAPLGTVPPRSTPPHRQYGPLEAMSMSVLCLDDDGASTYLARCEHPSVTAYGAADGNGASRRRWWLVAYLALVGGFAHLAGPTLVSWNLSQL